MKLLEKIIAERNESEKSKTRKFLLSVKNETKDQISKLKKENEKFKSEIKEAKDKTSAKINEITEQIDEYLIDIDFDKVNDKDLRKHYKNDFICGYLDKLLEIETINKKLEQTEKQANEQIQDNNDTILKLQTLLNEIE